MAKEFKPGEKVVWSSHGQDDTPGVVVRKITSETTAGGRKVAASEDEPSTWCAARRAVARRSTSRLRSSDADAARPLWLTAVPNSGFPYGWPRSAM